MVAKISEDIDLSDDESGGVGPATATPQRAKDYESF